ncbi:MAG: transglutaminase family protein [Cyanobacteria bacterium J06626_4]
MQYHLTHQTLYRYHQPVQLGAHTIRLRPRSDGHQQLRHFAISIEPQPTQISDVLDLEGNACMRLWFPDVPTTALKIRTEAQVETFCTNPFNYLSEPWAISAPIDYPSSVAAHLRPYLQPVPGMVMSPAVVEFAQGLLHEVAGQVGLFLSRLTQVIYEDFQYVNRPVGEPQLPGVTLSQKVGSCRDFAVLFMAACQAVGLAARFVSGYQEGDESQDGRELHAWPEVYIPGGGWRGFDPTHGLAVSDRHIPLVASAQPANAAPVSGQLKPGFAGASTLEYEIRISREPASER